MSSRSTTARAAMKALATVVLGVSVLAPGAASFALDGAWNVDASGDWSNPANWLDGNVADGFASTADLTKDISELRTVTIDTVGRTVGILNLGDADASHSYTINASGGGTLTFNNGFSDAQLNQLGTSAGDTISAPISLASSLVIANAAAANLTISGNITGGSTTITNAGTGAGATTISGVIGAGITGVVQNSATSDMVLTATNTFSGPLSVTAGKLTLTAANASVTAVGISSGATLQLGNAGTTGTVGGVITNDGTLIWSRSNTSGFSNTLAGGGTLILTGGGNYAINIGSTSGWTGTTIIESGTTVTASQVQAFGQNLNAPLIVQSGATVKMSGSAGIYLTPVTISGTGVNGLGAIYGNVDNPHLTGLVTLAGDATVRSEKSGQTIFFSGDVSDVGLTGAGTLTLAGIGGFTFNSGSAGDNTKGLIAETSSSNPVNLTVKGPGTTTINPNANTFTGVVTIDGGTLSVSKLANIGATSSIGMGDGASTATNRASLVFGGGTLRYTVGTNISTDRLLTLGNANGLNATISNTGGSYLKFTNTEEIGYGGSGARTLTLTGTSTAANDFAPIIGDGAGGATAVVKSGSGTWNLTSASALAYTGGTTVTGGTLTVAAATSLGANSTGNNVVVANDGKLTLNAAANIGGNQTFAFSLNPYPTTGFLSGALPQLTVAYNDALPAFAASSTAGVIALATATYSQALDLSTLPTDASESFLGAASAASYTSATLGAGAGNTYRLGGGGSTLTLSNAGAVLTGTGTSLVVGALGYNGNGATNATGTVVLQGANDYTGATLVNPGSTLTVSGANGTIAGSAGITVKGTLTLDNGAGNVDRIGNMAGVTLERGGALTLNTNSSASATEEIGTLTYTVNGTTTLTTATNRVTTLSAAGITRTGAATGLVRGTGLGGNGLSSNIARVLLGSTAGLNLIGTNDPNTTNGQSTVTNLKISPWLLANIGSTGTGSSFATYDLGTVGGLRGLSSGEMVTVAAALGNTNTDENVYDTGTGLALTADKTVNSLALAPTGTAAFGGGGFALNIASGGLALLTNQTTTLSNFSGLTLGASSNKEAVIHATTGTLVVNSPINAGLDYALTKGGGGAATLGTAQTFTGALTVNAGTLNINSSATPSAVAINGGTLGLTTTSTGALGSADVNINAGGTLLVNNSSSADLDIGGGTLYLNDGGAISLTGGGGTKKAFSNTVVVTGNGYLRQDSGAGSGNKTRIMGISMTPGAMLTINRTNSSTNGFGTGTVTLNETSPGGNATFNVLSISSGDSKATDFFRITGNGGFTKRGNGQLWLGFSGYFVAGETATASDYTGDTRVEEGALRIGMNDALPTGTTLYVNRGATFDLSSGGYENSDVNFNQQVAGLNDGSTGGGTVTANGTDANLGATRTLTLGGAGDYAFSGTIVNTSVNYTGSLALAKTGSGTQALSGASTYSGGTTVSGGKLLVNNTSGSGTGTGPVTVDALGTLGGAGTIAGAVTVNAGGTLAPGASAGALTLGGNLALDAANLNFELGDPLDIALSDRIDLAGTLSAAGTSTFNLTALTGFAAGTYTLIDYGTLGAGTTLANFALAAPTLAGFDVALADTGSAIVLNATGGGGPLSAGDGTWKNGAGDGKWSTHDSDGNNWAGGYPSAIKNVATFDASATNYAGGAVDVDAPQTIGKLVLNNASGYTLSGSAITLDNTGGSGNAAITALSGSHVLNSPVIAADNLDVSTAGTASLTLAGGITNPAGKSLKLANGGTGALDAGNVANAGAMTVEGVVSADAVGGIGTTTVNGSLTADSIVQDALTIGASGSVTIRETPSVAGQSNASQVPEPGVCALLCAGAACLLPLWRRRRR